MPEISVVIPTHNRAYCLPRAIRSVLLQSFRDLEIVVIDDGSTDGTKDVCRAFAATGAPLVYVSQAQSGVSSARNHGVRVSGGRFISFLDSDDLWMPQKLERQHALMASADTISMSFTNFFYFRDDGALSRKSEVIRNTFLEAPYPAILTIKENVIVTPSVMAPKSTLERAGGFNESVAICEDIDLWGRLMSYGELRAVDERLVGVHIRNVEGKFPYGKNILARCDLYARAYCRGDGVNQDHLAEMLDELANCFIGVATDRNDEAPVAYLSAAVHAKMSPVAYIAELRRIGRKLTAEGY